MRNIPTLPRSHYPCPSPTGRSILSQPRPGYKIILRFFWEYDAGRKACGNMRREPPTHLEGGHIVALVCDLVIRNQIVILGRAAALKQVESLGEIKYIYRVELIFLLSF